MNKIVLLLLLISLNLSAQNAKNAGWYIQEYHYPEIQLPSEFKTYQIKVNPNTDNVILLINKAQKSTSFKNPDITEAVNRLVEMPGFALSETPDFIIEFTDLGVKHILSVEEKTQGYGSDRGKVYTGNVNVSSSIKLVVKDINNTILYDKVYNLNNHSESAGVYNNATIKSSDIALSQIKKQYNANAIEYRSNKNLKIADNVISSISKSLKSSFSNYYESKRINLFLIKKEDKYGIQNNDQVEKLIAMNKLEFNDTYLENLEKITKESLTISESELEKIKDTTDKKQKKIYWSLLSNISGVHYALGNYDKAIEYAKMRERVDYNPKWKYNLEIAEKRKEIIDQIKK